MKQVENERHQLAEAFVSLVKGEQESPTRNQEQAMMSVLFASYEKESAQAISFLLNHVPTNVVRQFSYNYLYSSEQNAEVKTDVLVRPIPSEMMMTGNTGRYLIYLRHEDGTEQRLKFTNQSASVYYLMHLIDRHHKEGVLAPMSLHKNRETFTELYCNIYDIPRVKAKEKCERLIYRHVGDAIRAGRENEVIYDIRRHLEVAFREQCENYRPYAMTARAHLAVPANKIHFLDKAGSLLEMNFK